MQTHGGAAAETAITSSERIFRASLRVDWNGNGLYDHPLSKLDRYLDAVSVDMALRGSAPEELLLIEGASAAELTFTLNGEYENQTLTNVFSPFNKDSVFNGTQVIDREVQYTLKVETPDGTIEYPQFVGNVRTITPNRADNTVQITVLDRAEKMRKLIQLPPWAMSEEHVSYGEIDSQLVRSDWVIDHACRLCDVSPSPTRPAYREEIGAQDGVQLWVTGNGSYLPTVGWVDNMNASSFPNPGTEMYLENGPLHPGLPSDTPRPRGLAGMGLPIQGGPFNIRTSAEGVIRYWAADQDLINAGGAHYLGFTLNTNGTNGNAFQTIGKHEVLEVIIGESRALYVYIQNGQVWTERHYWTSDTSKSIEATSTKVNIPTGQTNVPVFIQWDLTGSSSTRVYVRAGTNSTGGWETKSGSVQDDYLRSVDQIKGRVSIGHALNLSDIYYSTRNMSPSIPDYTDNSYRPATYAAKLDRGVNRFSFMPSAERQEAWSLVQQVAAAEFGSVFWDENGVFHFWNWETMLSKRDTIARTYSLDEVENLQVTNSVDSVRNVYNVVTRKRRATGGVITYESNDVNEFYVAPQTTQRFSIWVDDIVSPLTWVPERHKGDERAGSPIFYTWSEGTVHGYVVQYYDDHHGSSFGPHWAERDEFEDPEVTTYFTGQGNLTVRITNNEEDRPIRMAIGLSTNNGEDITVESPVAAFRVSGTKIVEASELALPYLNEPSIRKYGSRSWDLNSDWYQDALTQTRLLDMMMERTAEPQPTTDAITVAGDPRIQLGDVIRVTDPNGFGEEILLQVYGIKRDYTIDGGLTDTLTVEMVPAPPDPDQPDPPVTETRYNLCPNPALSKNTTGWYNGVGRVTGVTGMSRTTGYSSTGARVVLPKGEVEPGKRYVFSAEIKGNGGASTGRAYVDWYSRSGYMIGGSETTFTVANGQVRRVYTPITEAPPGAEKGLLVIDLLDSPAIITAALYEETSSATGTYFDGDTSGANWDGKAGNSTSRLLPSTFFGE